jgi:tetratricopeptide (TPR) repeat protein
MLPGLLGAALLAGADLLERHAPSAARGRARLAAVALGAALLALFAQRSAERARLWRSPVLLLADAAAHYPHGVPASLLRAQRAAQAGDAEAAVTALRAAMARGYIRFQQLLGDPALAPVREHPAFQALVREMAADWIETYAAKGELTQLELRTVAGAHVARGEYREATRLLERALEVGGPTDAEVRAELAALRPHVAD